jgi:hypothetical protein
MSGRKNAANRRGMSRDTVHRSTSRAAVAIEDARQAGLLDGEATEHLSVRLPKALVDAAKLEAGTEQPTELIRVALALLAKPDPTVKFILDNYGGLGSDHGLEY